MKKRIAHLESLENRRLLAAWQNIELPCDVDRSGLVTPLDAEILIGDLNQTGPRFLEGQPTENDRLVDVSGNGIFSPIDVLRVFNVLNRYTEPLELQLSLAPQQDLNNNGTVLGDSIQLIGKTARAAKIQLTSSILDAQLQADPSRQLNTQVQADIAGNFSFEQPLEIGLNHIKIRATDPLGRTLTATRDLVRGDLVSDWNAALLNMVRDFRSTSNDLAPGRLVTAAPPMVARNLAMIHTAMFDAMNGVLKQFQSYLPVESLLPEELITGPIIEDGQLTNVAATAAGTNAAYHVAKTLYPETNESLIWEATLAETLATLPDGPAKQAGITFGQRVAIVVLENRASDGADATINYQPSGQPGGWNRTAPDFSPPLLPHWPQVAPFIVDDVTDFRPEPPPDLTTSEYAASVDEVLRLGAVDSPERTADQSEIAVFWEDGGGTATPPGHWNRIASRISLDEQLSPLQHARVMAILNLALADAGIASWDAKYAYDLWRPIDAIRLADSDTNNATSPDENWLPLLPTPPFPTYTSGHSTFSGAADAVLTTLFGDSYTFASTIDSHTGPTPDASQQPTTRQFASFAAAAEEAGLSRIYGGIHFDFDNTAGLTAGRAIGHQVATTALQPS